MPTCGTRREKEPTSLALQQLAAAMQARQLTSFDKPRRSETGSTGQRLSYFGSFQPGQQLNNPSVSAEAQPAREPRGAYLIRLDVNIY